MQKNGILFTSNDCPDLTKISINGKLKSLGVESIDVEKTIDLSEKIEFDVSLNDGIEFFSKVECFKDGDYYKLRFYPSEKLEQVVSIPYWMTRKGMTIVHFMPFIKVKRLLHRRLQQDMGQTGEYKDVLIATQKIKIS
ncbi:MAG: hypothetical protein MR694_08410 [Spirochaetia bacterium]|nr:hypothetical protein [Spirochaetia bacterium]